MTQRKKTPRPKGRLFKKILIANRGEIACRIVRTARRLGIATVAVYSDADRDALHVQSADEAVRIGLAPSAQSYLSIEAIVEAAKKTGADAVHPGYGFLSENAAFARAAARAGITFIGPGVRAITVMGDKIESKKLAAKIGVSTIPGHLEALKDGREALKAARKIGFPVILKAAAGGGGKGMRIARTEAEVADGFRFASSEARSSFGDDRVFLEKYIEEPRHIEIQILADGHGNAVYLGERECSIQRRHQKVIEEAPSPFLDAATRKAMGEQAVALAKAVDYASAGTVEFVVDRHRNFYFLEMNTRLQVEHPVTECVTGLDLVELMIRIAAGERLPMTQADVRLDGWAIEARVYAEDPFRNFLPSVGRLVRFQPPAEDDVVRVDTGVFEGGEISIYYDPMIAKLITRGATRDAAIHAMRQALDGFLIRGVSNNICFLAALVGHPRFAEGRLSTNFIAEEYPSGFNASLVPHEDAGLLAAVAAAVHRTYWERGSKRGGRQEAAKRIGGSHWVAVRNGHHADVTIHAVPSGFNVTVAGKPYDLRTQWGLGQPVFVADVGGRRLSVQVERRGAGYRLIHSGLETDILILEPRTADYQRRMPLRKTTVSSSVVRAPMPGLLVSVAVAAGQEVKAGEELAVIEAMKMENVILAERDGTIGVVHVKPGDSLSVDQPLLEYAKPEARK